MRAIIILFLSYICLALADTYVKSGSRVILDNMIVRANGNVYRAFESEQPSIFTISKCTPYKSQNNTLLGGMTVTLRDKNNRVCFFDRNQTLKCSNNISPDCNIRMLSKHDPDKIPIQYMSLVKLRMTNNSLDCGAEKSTTPISCARRWQQPWYTFIIMPV
jgi:hypothetical protein